MTREGYKKWKHVDVTVDEPSWKENSEYRIKPKEIWVNFCESEHYAYDSESQARAMASEYGVKIYRTAVKFIEA